MRVAYDVTFPAQAYFRGHSQTGVSRMVDELLRALCRRPDLRMTAVGLMGADRHPVRTSVQGKVYAEKTHADCASTLTHHSRLGLTSGYAHRFLEDARRQVATADTLTANSNLPAEPLGLRPAPVRAIRRALSHVVSLDAVQQLATSEFDVFHATYRPLPARRVTSGVARVATIHDLIPIHSPASVVACVTTELEQVLRSIDLRRDHVLCVSEHVKRQVCGHLRIAPERVTVAPEAAAPHFEPVSDSQALNAARRRYGIPDRPYFLTVSNPQPRKNLPVLLRAFRRMLEGDPDLPHALVLAGSRKMGWMNEPIDREMATMPQRIAERISFTGYVQEHDLAAVYSAATAFVFPSLDEGFGLPPLEAMACGLPVITSNAASLPEVVGDAGLMVPPTDEDGFVDAMQRVGTDDGLRQDLAARSLARASTFTWDRTAAIVATAYQAAVRQSD